MEEHQPQHEQPFENHENDTSKIQPQQQDLDNAFSYLSSFPPGYRFEPHDHELIDRYLVPKINGDVLPTNLMHEINIYKYNPEYLTDAFKAQGQNIWYFFTSRDRKYRNGRRPNRKAGDGYWKATGADKVIKHQGVEVGFRKALVFYKGKPPKGDKTPWIMHEFRVSGPPQANKRKRLNDNEDTSMRLDDYVLCRIYKKEEGLNRNQSRSQQKHDILEEEQEEAYDVPSIHPDLDQPDETDSSSVDNNIRPNTILGPEITSYNLNIKGVDNINNIINQYSPMLNSSYVGMENKFTSIPMFKPVGQTFQNKTHPSPILMHGFSTSNVGDNVGGYLDFTPHENDQTLIYDNSLIPSLSEAFTGNNDIMGTDFNQNLVPPYYGGDIKPKLLVDHANMYGSMAINGDHDLSIGTKFDDHVNITGFY